MNTTDNRPSRTDVLDKIQLLYDNGQYLKGWTLAKALGPLKDWRGSCREMVLGGRLAFNLGSQRLGTVMHRLALREYPDDPMAIAFEMLTMSGRRGPWATLQRMKLHGDLPNAEAINRSDWFALKSLCYGQLRDFQKAEYWQAKALELSPASPWLYVTLTSLLESQDRNDEATAAAEKAVSIRPTYRPAVQALANRYIESNRDKEAISLLFKGVKEIESGMVRLQLASFYRELEFYDHAMKLYDGIESFFPLLSEDSKYEQWLFSAFSDLHYLNGNHTKALELAQRIEDDEFYETFSKRLTDPNIKGKRVQLGVKYVKQHHVTCAPATLTAIVDYWNKDVGHLDVVEKICYDGTPSYSQRRWAAQTGFKTVDFTVTWEVATALIDRGLPFTLTTIEPGNGHLQPIIGYDSFRKTLITRDPGNRHANEMIFDKVQERYASTGPRGMALVPSEHADKLEGIPFQDAKEYDLLFNIELCLEKHNRQKANEIVVLMEQHFPDHRLTLRARNIVSRYDSDRQELLTTVDKMLAQHPDDVNFQLDKLGCLYELGRKEDRLTTLREIRNSDKCHPLFWTRLASELIDDARETKEVDYLLKRAVRYRYYDGYGFYLLGVRTRDQGQDDEALELFRLAACLDDMNEHRSHVYFSMARKMNRMDEAMNLLEDRVNRFGAKNPSPVITLVSAFEEMDQTDKSFEALEKAMEHHSADGDFLLYYADFCSRYGRVENARALLQQAEAHCGRQQWLQSAAKLAHRTGDFENAMIWVEELIAAEPLNVSVHSHAANLIANRDGSAAAIAHIRKHVNQFPSSYSLRQLLINWMYREKADTREAEVKAFLEIHPGDAWALRELASVSADLKKFDQAAAAIDKACEVDPNSPETWGFRGEVYRKQNRIDEAIHSYRAAISAAVDYQYAMHELMGCCNTRSQRQEQLDFILAEINRQTSSGDGLLIYRQYATQVLEPDVLLQVLVEFLGRRPDLWQAWVALSQQLSDMQSHEQAVSIAETATKKFQFLPRIWMQLASCWSACGEWDKQIESLQRAHEINSNWGDVIRELAEAWDKKGEFELAREQIEKAINLDPRNAVNFGYLADLIWRNGDREKALDTIAQAVRLDPDYEFGWSALRAWCEQLGKPDFDVAVANNLCAERPEEARSWMKLAFCLDQPHQVDDAIEAIDKALAIDRLLVKGYSQKAMLHCSVGRFDEAQQVLATDVFGANYPVELAISGAICISRQGDRKAALEKMMEVVEREPDSFGAWRYVADWSGELKNDELFLTAAENMTRLEPQYHLAWRYLGEARDKEGNLDLARQQIEKAINLDPRNSINLGCLADILWRNGNREEALETIAKSVRLDPEYDFGWSALRSWCEQLGQPDYDVEVANELCRERPDEPDSWMKLAFCLDQPHQVDDSIAAIDKALEINPQFIGGYRRKAAVLASVGRYAEAQRVLATEAFGDNHPVELSVQSAVMVAEQGNTKAALDAMLDIVEREPDSFKAWQCIADWSGDLELKELYSRAAQNMARVEPQYFMAWGYLAESEFMLGNRNEAKSHLKKALQLSPDYGYATKKLLNLSLEDGEFDEAVEVINISAPHLDAETRLSELVRIESLRGDRHAAFRYFKEFAVTETDNSECLAENVLHIQKAGWNDEFLQILDELLEDPDALPAVADAHALHCARLEKWAHSEMKLDKVRGKRALWDAGMSRYLQEAQNASDFERFFRLLDAEREFIRATIDGWQSVGWLFLRANDFDRCIEWMHDWRVRTDAECWAIYNVATAYFSKEMDHKAAEVAQSALTKDDCGGSIEAMLKVILGNHTLAYGDPEKAFELLSTVDPDYVQPFLQIVYFQAMIALEVIRAEGSFSQAKKELQEFFAQIDDSFENEKPLYLRNQNLILWSIARRSGKSIRAALLKRKSNAKELV
jgi:tetratricopeptide (TPR) repeat protein